MLQLYHSRACRSPQYLYRLTKLWRIDAGKVEEACNGVSEVGRLLIESIEQALNPRIEAAPDPVAEWPPRGMAKRAVEVVAVGTAPPGKIGLAVAPKRRTQEGGACAMKSEGTTPVLVTSRLYGTNDGRAIELLLQRRSSHDGAVVARFVGS